MKNQELKHTEGEWKVQRTSLEDEDFQGRILCYSSEKTSHESNHTKPQVCIIVGEPSKINGAANIHFSANAKLIAAAPDLLKACIKLDNARKRRSDNNRKDFTLALNEMEKAIKKATK